MSGRRRWGGCEKTRAGSTSPRVTGPHRRGGDTGSGECKILPHITQTPGREAEGLAGAVGAAILASVTTHG